MNCFVESMNTWLYPHENTTGRKTAVPALKAARGGSTGFQIYLDGLQAGSRMTVRFATAGGGLQTEAFRLLPVTVEQNTGVRGFTADWETAADYATRRAPFEVYDAAAPVAWEGFSVSGDCAAIYISLRFDRAAAPGIYEGTVHIACGDEKAAINFAVTAADVVLPEETLKMTNWFSLENMAAAHGVDEWSEEHWRLIEAYGRQMRRIHQNVFWVPWDTVDVKKTAEGWQFDFSKTERLIRLYLGLGFRTIEGSPLYSRESWDAAEFGLGTPAGRVPALSEEAYDLAAALLTAWRDFLQEHGWYERLIQHVGDEPHEKAAQEYRILTGIVRKHLPGVPLIEAVETYELAGAVDIWVPKNNYYAENRDAFEAYRAKGDEIWFYTCCIPGGHYANRLLDLPLLRARMLHWGNWRYRLPGFLHWGLNHWEAGKNPFTDTCPGNGPVNRLPAGDQNILYPLGGEVIGSMRAEMMKCGSEDYELLALLASRGEEAADAVCGLVFRAFDDCDNTPEVFEAAHDRLLEALAGV